MHCFPLSHGLARLLLGVGLASAALAAPARAETVLAMESAPTAVSAYGERVAWWSVDPATHRGHLMTWVGAHAQRVDIAPVRKAYALDLGPTANGHVAAVYARCDARGNRCDVYEYDFAARREQRVKVADSPRISERLPPLWKRRIAFVENATDRTSGRIIWPACAAGRGTGSVVACRAGAASTRHSRPRWICAAAR